MATLTRNQMFLVILCINIRVVRILFDELTTRRHIITHKHRECTLSFSCILDCDLTEKSLLRIHGSRLELLGAHFSKTFVTLHKHTLLGTFTQLKGSFLTLLLSPAVYLLLAFLDKIERRCSEVYITVLDKIDHIAEVSQCGFRPHRHRS